MFKWLFRSRRNCNITSQPIGEVFAWPKGTVLKPHDALVLALPLAMLGPGEKIGSVIECDDDAEISIPDGDDKIYIRLRVGMRISPRKSVQAFVLPYDDGETSPKRIEVILAKALER